MGKTSKVAAADIAAVRRFNRYYTRQLGLLDEHLLASEFSLTEVRALYELAQQGGRSAAALVRELGVDAGYLSRVLKKLHARGLLQREGSSSDARQTLLTLSAAGRAAFAPLERASREQVRRLLAALKPYQLRELLAAMQRIEALSSASVQSAPAVPYLLRPLRIGDIGWIAHRQGVLYAQEYRWDQSFEALVAEIAAAFVKKRDAQRENAWIAERDGQIVGAVFLVQRSKTVAQLRLLYVEPSARGLGIGRRLTDECIRFAREQGYRRLMLWTNDVLGAARRIYAAAGFVLTQEERHHSFGHDLVGQNWELDLGPRLPVPGQAGLRRR